MFGGSSSSVIKPEGAIDDAGTDTDAKGAGNRDDPGGSGGDGRNKSPSPPRADGEQKTPSSKPIPSTEKPASNEKRAGNNSPPASGSSAEQKKRRSSGVSSRASSLLASAKNSLSFSQTGRFGSDAASSNQTPLQKLGKQDAALAVPQGQHNNSAGESVPGPRSTFRVGVWEDRNKKCRRTMEDTHAFLYNFLRTPAPAPIGTGTGTSGDKDNNSTGSGKPAEASESDAVAPDDSSLGGADAGETSLETDNGYFAIFDGHAGTFAADWCGKKLHLVLEDIIRKNPNVPVPELLDQTFTSVDAQLEKLPLKNSGCTAAIAVLRWEDRVPSNQSATGSQGIAVAAAARANEEAAPRAEEKTAGNNGGSTGTSIRSIDVEAAHAKLKPNASRQRVLYTANVGDARIILCRSGKALRLSYDHKGSDENEGRRIANAGGLILNNRVNGVLAVTRALGDTYIKDLVTGHPYTTETVIQPDIDEFMIIACDGLWDVCSDQDAVNLVRSVQDPAAAAKMLVDHALAHFSTDNLSCMIVRFDREALAETQKNKDGLIGVEGDEAESAARPSEADKIVSTVKQKIAEGGTPAVGVSASNSGHGHESAQPAATATVEDAFKRTAIEGSVEEEPASASGSSALESTLDGSGRATEPEDTLREPGTKPATESGSKS